MQMTHRRCSGGLPNNPIPPGYCFAIPGEYGALAAPQGLTELQKSSRQICCLNEVKVNQIQLQLSPM